MKPFIPAFIVMITNTALSQDLNSISKMIIETEKSALERWNNGDPSGFLEISAKDVVYFDPFTEQRLNGLENLTKLYESIRGQIKVDKYEMINPIVQSVDNMAVLTYNLDSYSGSALEKWNCTEVYRFDDKKWKIIQTHWSFTKPRIQN
jgi:hypothetical protein